MQQLGRAFLSGLVTLLPIGLSLYLLWWLGTSAEAVFGAVIRAVLPAGWYQPGIGLVFGVALLLVVGFAMRAVVARRLYAAFGKLVERVPLLKSIYGPLRDLASFVATGDEQRKLGQVVRVRFADTGLTMVGFRTKEDAREVTGDEAEAGRVAVYLPMSYQIGGYMALVPQDWVEPLDLGAEEALKLTLTAGLTGRTEAPPAV